MDSRVVMWITDCYSYLQYLSAVTPGTVSDKRLAIDLSALRQELWRLVGEEVGDPSQLQSIPVDASDQLYWVSTGDMIADAMTKSMRWDAIRDVCTGGTWVLNGACCERAGFGPVKIEECETVGSTSQVTNPAAVGL